MLRESWVRSFAALSIQIVAVIQSHNPCERIANRAFQWSDRRQDPFTTCSSLKGVIEIQTSACHARCRSLSG